MTSSSCVVPSLPIHGYEQAIVEAVRDHAVVVIEGPAGTGKTTQLPRMLQRAGLVPRRLGMTQPRRMAAVSVAWRMAEEEGVRLGQQVGYAIRFDDCSGPDTRLKVMTDGILLQEARHDPDLAAYDILIVDEAHERSLNIDFTLGLLHRILKRRTDLRVIISSATLHPGHFQKFFASVSKAVPLIKIESRTYPVEVQYAPLHRYGLPYMIDVLCKHVSYLHHHAPPGHILIFLSGEGAIQRLQTALQGLDLPRTQVLPLYGRLTREEQEIVFAPFVGRRKIILATNIAETSLTIEDVHHVIDCGLAKLPWFNPSTGVTTLREEPISQASAIQRAGRAGRTGPGTVIRLYDKASFKHRPAYTPEEMLRVDLSEVVLRLIDLGIRNVKRFPFPTPPPASKLTAALDLLVAMRAIDADRRLTALGKQMVAFPLSPSLARMVVEAVNHFPQVVKDVLWVGAFLSARSPWMCPAGQEIQARAAQRRWWHPLGDVITALEMFRHWKQALDAQAFCKEAYVDPDTMEFIAKTHHQLCDIAASHGVNMGYDRGDPQHIVRCIAAGFPDKILRRRGPIFEVHGKARDPLKVVIHPSSSLYGARPRCVVATELISAGRTYALHVSALKPEWLTQVHPSGAQKIRQKRKHPNASFQKSAKKSVQKPSQPCKRRHRRIKSTVLDRR